MTFHLDVDNGFFLIDEVKIPINDLSTNEIAIIGYLMEVYPETALRDDLIRLAWPNKVVTPTSLNVSINNIRKSFSRYIESGGDILQTERGVGYKLVCLSKYVDVNSLSTPSKTNLEEKETLSSHDLDSGGGDKENNNLKHSGKITPRYFLFSKFLLPFINILLLLLTMYILSTYLEALSL